MPGVFPLHLVLSGCVRSVCLYSLIKYEHVSLPSTWLCGCAGQPEFAVDVDNMKPTGLVVAAAVTMLLLGKPLSGSRGFGGLQFGLPSTGTCTAKASISAFYQASLHLQWEELPAHLISSCLCRFRSLSELLRDVDAQAESKAVVERRGKGLLVSVKQINGVLRF